MKNNEVYDPERLISWVLRKFYKHVTNIERDDLFQAGYLGYLKARKNYDITKANDNSMSTEYACYYIRSEINNYLKQEVTKIIQEPKDLLYNTNDDYADTSEFRNDYLYYKYSAEDELESDAILDCHQLQQLITQIPPKYANILNDIYFKEKSLVEIAAERGVTKQRIEQIKKAALKKMRDILEKEEDL